MSSLKKTPIHTKEATGLVELVGGLETVKNARRNEMNDSSSHRHDYEPKNPGDYWWICSCRARKHFDVAPHDHSSQGAVDKPEHVHVESMNHPCPVCTPNPQGQTQADELRAKIESVINDATKLDVMSHVMRLIDAYCSQKEVEAFMLGKGYIYHDNYFEKRESNGDSTVFNERQARWRYEEVKALSQGTKQEEEI